MQQDERSASTQAPVEALLDLLLDPAERGKRHEVLRALGT
jgi:hypothetical protein